MFDDCVLIKAGEFNMIWIPIRWRHFDHEQKWPRGNHVEPRASMSS